MTTMCIAGTGSMTINRSALCPTKTHCFRTVGSRNGRDGRTSHQGCERTTQTILSGKVSHREDYLLQGVVVAKSCLASLQLVHSLPALHGSSRPIPILARYRIQEKECTEIWGSYLPRKNGAIGR
ncbi:uncharacterized protein YALI1_C25747g [Yarrowia lipolytica]|uniref:Uncharacterized protein n=1 Tax=Yarrowia lipolytica TaxID=4952 RepID=A0A1D8NBP3_YARLL|nr:hypothetical protein YALI1_C25747g [Yarrowia lipolytica]